MDLTIRWLFEKNSELDSFKCLAGESGIDRRITGINIMDNPDTVPWLKKDELILSTGYIFSVTDIYKTIITDLYEKGCSGLGIKMNRYMDTLPNEMIEQANKLGFTIFSIPFSSTMEQIVNIVYRQMFSNEMSESEKMMTLYRDITETVLKRHSTLPLMEIISNAVNEPVFLTTDSFEIIEYNIPETSDIHFPFPYNDDCNLMFPTREVSFLKDKYQNNPLPVIKHTITYENITHNFVIFPILLRQKTLLGYLVCIEEKAPFSSFEYALMSNINSMLCIAMINTNITRDEQQSDRSVFFADLLSGVLKTDNEIEPVCRRYGFDYTLPRICVSMKIDGYTEMSGSRRVNFIRNILSVVKQTVSEMELDFSHTVYDNHLVLFLFMSKTESKCRLQKAAKCINKIIQKLEIEKIYALAGISNCYEGSSKFVESYVQSSKSLELGKKLHPDEKVFIYANDMHYHILSSSFTTAQLNDIYSNTLKPLDNYDKSTGSDLSYTLYKYLECGQNIAKVAKELFIHRNTMIYRLKQISEIIDFDCKNLDNLYMIQTAFYVKKLLSI